MTYTSSGAGPGRSSTDSQSGGKAPLRTAPAAATLSFRRAKPAAHPGSVPPTRKMNDGHWSSSGAAIVTAAPPSAATAPSPVASTTIALSTATSPSRPASVSVLASPAAVPSRAAVTLVSSRHVSVTAAAHTARAWRSSTWGWIGSTNTFPARSTAPAPPACWSPRANDDGNPRCASTAAAAGSGSGGR